VTTKGNIVACILMGALHVHSTQERFESKSALKTKPLRLQLTCMYRKASANIYFMHIMLIQNYNFACCFVWV
jgi:hypothetical protein